MAKRTAKRVLIVLGFLKMSYVDLVTFMRSIIANTTGNANVPTPIVGLVLMGTQVDALNATNIARQTNKSKTLTDTAADQANTCLDSLTSSALQVEDIANTVGAGNVEAAKAIINAIGYQIKKDADRRGRSFEVVSVMTGGAKLRTKAAPKPRAAIYLWQYTATPATPDSWSQVVMTFQSAVSIIGLQSDKRGYFRSAVIENPGRDAVVDLTNMVIDWSDPISAMIP